MLDFQGSRWLINGEVPKQAGNNHPTSIPTGVFKTADGHINIAAAGQHIWERFCNALETPELIHRPEYKNSAARLKNRDALNDEIGRHTPKRTSADWVERFNQAGVPSGPIYSVDQVYADPQVAHLGMAQPIKTTDKERPAWRASRCRCRTPSKLVASPPGLGEHTDAVLRNSGSAPRKSPRCARPRLSDGVRGARGRPTMDDKTKTEKMLSRKDGRVGYVIFNNPERRNAVSLDMWARTTEILTDFARDDEVRVVVLTGAGGKAFVSGADVSRFESERSSLDATRVYNQTVEKANASILRFPSRPSR